MTRLLSSLLRRDPPDRPLLEQLRDAFPKQRTARILYAKPDGREKMTHCVRVLRSVMRRTA